MIEYDNANNPHRIIIPVSGPEEVLRYQQGMLGLLRKIEIVTCSPDLRRDVKTVFELLGHILSAENLDQFKEAKDLMRDSKKEKPAPDKGESTFA